MKLATSTGDLNGFADTPAGLLELLSRTPFKYVDLDIAHRYMGDDWETVADSCGEVAARHGMTFVQAHAGDFYIGGIHGTPCFLQLERAIQTCARLGIPQMVIHAQFTPDILYHGGDVVQMARFHAFNRGLYEKLFPIMERTGVKVLVENSAEANMGHFCYYMTGAELAAFLDEVNHPLLGAVWDIGHANLRGNDQYADLYALGHRLCGVHIQDNDGRQDEHTAPFMGTTDLDAVMSGLCDIGYTGYFTFECFNYPMRGGSWPYARHTDPARPPKLFQPSIDLKISAETYLYQIGKYMLEQYNVYEA